MPAATGSLALSITALKSMIDLSATFVAASGTSWINKAPAGTSFPFAEIHYGPGPIGFVIAGGDKLYIRPAGEIEVWLTYQPDYVTNASQNDHSIEALNYFGKVIDEVLDISGGSGFLDIYRPEILWVEETPEEMWASDGRYYHCGLLFKWGDDSQR